MHRFHLPPSQCHGSTLILEDREAHHALHVLRLRRGDRVTVLDGAGHEFVGEVRDLDRKAVSLAVIEKRFVPPLPYQITLLQAIPKGKIIESIIQKATELGVFRIVPLLSERVTTHLDEDTAESKTEKWRGTAIEAIKQCGSPWLPQIEPPITPADFLARKEKVELSLIASLQENARHARHCFEAFLTEHQRLPQSVSIWIGPEGDFAPAELSGAISAGAQPITLGRLVLRVETAAICALSLLNYELQTERGP